MQVFFVNNNGGGFADYVEVNENTTVGQFFENHMQDANAADYRIRVNREPVPAGRLLRDGDKISITPNNVKGA